MYIIYKREVRSKGGILISEVDRFWKDSNRRTSDQNITTLSAFSEGSEFAKSSGYFT